MFAIIEGVNSARHLARLCTRDVVYEWICGDVGVNDHMVSDFRTDHGKFLDELLTDTIATLLHQQIVTLETVAQDGMRVRASAGSGSFRRPKSLEECRRQAAEQVPKLRDENDDESESGGNARRKAAVRDHVQLDENVATGRALTKRNETKTTFQTLHGTKRPNFTNENTNQRDTQVAKTPKSTEPTTSQTKKCDGR